MSVDSLHLISYPLGPYAIGMYPLGCGSFSLG